MVRSSLIYLLCFISYSSFAQQTFTDTIWHDGMAREFIVYLPATYTGTEAVPLVLNFHGYTNYAQEHMEYGDFRAIADTANFIVVHPQGTLDNTFQTYWNVGGWTTGNVTDDLGFVESLMDTLLEDYLIDETRIYSTGFSNGGFLSFYLACNYGERLAAIVAVSGAVTGEILDSCNSANATPVLQFHGTGDFVIPYYGGLWSESVDAALQLFIDKNDCAQIPVTSSVPDINLTDGSTVTNMLYEGGTNGSVVEHYQIVDGGHTWPGATDGSPFTNLDINASKLIWEFFSKYNIYGLINTNSINEKNDDLQLISVYPTPAQSFITIENRGAGSQTYSLHTISGSIVKQGSINIGQHKLAISNLKNGYYLLKIGSQTFNIIKTQ